MPDSYRRLAADYDWIFDDGALVGGAAINQPATARLLQRIGPASTVLDAACGTGIDAAVLARRGFTVRAADGSEAMVEVAAARFRRDRLAIPVQRCLWADLPDAINERFDAVLCTGNALVHAVGRDAMVQSLIGLRRMARPGGHVVIDSRNWDKLHAERRIVQVMDRVRIRGGRRCVVVYAWEVPDRLDQEHIAHLVFLFEDGDRIEPHEYRLSFRPFTLGELRERLELAGLQEADTDYDEAADRYSVIAWQPPLRAAPGVRLGLRCRRADQVVRVSCPGQPREVELFPPAGCSGWVGQRPATGVAAKHYWDPFRPGRGACGPSIRDRLRCPTARVAACRSR